MPNLNNITPVILTYNEEDNLARTLDGVGWAKKIVVFDSGSDDRTIQIASARSNVTIRSRPFDTHASQWNHAIGDDSISTDWILTLDADHLVPQALTEEIAAAGDDPAVDAYEISFRYAVLGKILRSGVYPPTVSLFRRGRGSYVQDGHTQRIVIEGRRTRLRHSMIHDDRKSISRWSAAQIRYAQLEAEKLLHSRRKNLKIWLRTHTPLAGILVALYCLFIRGGLLDGPPGWLYALQRMTSEGLISTFYLEYKLKNSISSG